MNIGQLENKKIGDHTDSPGNGEREG